MIDIKRMRELLAEPCWCDHTCDRCLELRPENYLPALLDELERLRAELAFRDAPDEPLSAGEIDSIVKRVLAEESK